MNKYVIIKLLIVLSIISSLFLTLCSCGHNVIIKGIENFSPGDSEFSLCSTLMPNHNFINQYEYIEADYYYSDYCKDSCVGFGEEHVIIYFEYDEEIYNEAKDYCLSKFPLSEKNRVEYNGYVFIENVWLKEENDEPFDLERFQMFIYNDGLNRLVFMGYKNMEDYFVSFSPEQSQNVLDDWETFLEQEFAEVYDFSK